MLSLLFIASIIFQTAMAIFLLNGVRTKDNSDKHFTAMLLIIVVHLTTKFLLLSLFNDHFLYGRMPTGFGLAYGPLLLVILCSVEKKPMSPTQIFYQFVPFLFFSAIYVFLVVEKLLGNISPAAIIHYAAWYEWLVIASLYGYPIYIKRKLKIIRNKLQEASDAEPSRLHLVGQIANVLLIGISAGLSLTLFHWKGLRLSGFDLRLVPYLCFSAIPFCILRWRMQNAQETEAFQQSNYALGTQPQLSTMTITAPLPEAQLLGQTGQTVLVLPIPQQELPVRQPAIIPEQPAIVEAPEKRYEKSGLDLQKMQEYEARLSVYMKKSKAYLNADLSLEMLASQIKIPKHHMTQLLNDGMMKNFYNYVNEYRISEAMERLSSKDKNVNMLSLAFDCGFNSKSSFNSYFKKITGSTPSAYRKTHANAPINK